MDNRCEKHNKCRYMHSLSTFEFQQAMHPSIPLHLHLSSLTCFSSVIWSNICVAPGTFFKFLIAASAGSRTLASGLKDCWRATCSASTADMSISAIFKAIAKIRCDGRRVDQIEAKERSLLAINLLWGSLFLLANAGAARACLAENFTGQGQTVTYCNMVTMITVM